MRVNAKFGISVALALASVSGCASRPKAISYPLKLHSTGDTGSNRVKVIVNPFPQYPPPVDGTQNGQTTTTFKPVVPGHPDLRWIVSLPASRGRPSTPVGPNLHILGGGTIVYIDDGWLQLLGSRLTIHTHHVAVSSNSCGIRIWIPTSTTAPVAGEYVFFQGDPYNGDDYAVITSLTSGEILSVRDNPSDGPEDGSQVILYPGQFAWLSPTTLNNKRECIIFNPNENPSTGDSRETEGLNGTHQIDLAVQ